MTKMFIKSMRECLKNHKKRNFFISNVISGSSRLYIHRSRIIIRIKILDFRMNERQCKGQHANRNKDSLNQLPENYTKTYRLNSDTFASVSLATDLSKNDAINCNPKGNSITYKRKRTEKSFPKIKR